MCRGMSKPYRLKVRQYAARLIGLNYYLALFPEATLSVKIGVTELNEILLNIMHNRWSTQAYVQGFNFGPVVLWFAPTVRTHVKLYLLQLSRLGCHQTPMQ